MVHGQEEGKGKTYQGKYYQDPGVKVCLGYIADNPQGQEQNIDGTHAVQHGKDKEELGYVGLLFPKIKKVSHACSP
jgi:hypothetical protein